VGDLGLRLTCTVLSRTTWDTVSRSCAAMPGFPRPRVNFLSLILANAVRRRSGPGSVPPSDAPAASGRIGHRARPRRGTIGHISQPPRRSQSMSIKIARPTPVDHHQSHPVLSRRAAPLPSDPPSIPHGFLSPFLKARACADPCYASLSPRAGRCDACKLERVDAIRR